MTDVTYTDQLNEAKEVIGEYAHFDKVIKTERVILNKEELILKRDKVEAELLDLNTIINGFK